MDKGERKEGDKSPSTSKGWFVTANNPDEWFEWAKGIDYETAGADEYQAVLKRAIDAWVSGGKGKRRSPEKNFVSACFERGKGGTPHMHILLLSESPMRFSTVQKKFPHAHIETVRSTPERANRYIHKGETRLCDPVEWGNYVPKQAGGNGDAKGKRGRSEIFGEIEALIDGGVTPTRVVSMGMEYAFYKRSVYDLWRARNFSDTELLRDVKVYYHWGKSGSGKSYSSVTLTKKKGRGSVYKVMAYKHPWDEYEGQDTIFLEELRPGCLELTTLLGVLDGYEMTLDARYENKVAKWHEVHIASVLTPWELFDGITKGSSDTDDYEQLRRRIDFVVIHYQKDGEYLSKVVEMPKGVDGDEWLFRQWEELTGERWGGESRRGGRRDRPPRGVGWAS